MENHPGWGFVKSPPCKCAFKCQGEASPGLHLALEGILQKNTGSSNVRLEIEVAPVEDKSTQPYTDQEKATVLMDKSSEVKNLVRDFGLETE